MVSTPSIRVSKGAVADYLLGGLGYSGTGAWATPTLLQAGLDTYRKAVGSGMSHVPFFLALDLRALAELGNETSFVGDELDGIESSVRSEYSNRVLSRLAREFCIQQAFDVLAYHRAVLGGNGAGFDEVASRSERLALLLLEQLSPYWPRTFLVNAAHLRDLVLPSPRDLEAAIVEAARNLATSFDGRLDLAAMVGGFVHGTTGASAGSQPIIWSRVIGPEDLFELENLHVLDKEYLRIQARDLIAVRESIPVFDPHRINVSEEQSEVETLFVDQSRYPTGGFSELTTSGSFENLVLSELVYMGEAAGGNIDLFDVRFVENELLYYTRDSGQLFRKRRTVNLVIDLRWPLSFKYPSHRYQLKTIVSGFVLAVVRDLGMLFGNDSLHFRICLLAPPRVEGDEEAQKLREVLELLLAAPIQRGNLATELVDELHLRDLASGTRKSYAILMSPNPPALDGWAATLAELRTRVPPLFGMTISLADGEHTPSHHDVASLHLDLEAGSLAALSEELFEALLRA